MSSYYEEHKKWPQGHNKGKQAMKRKKITNKFEIQSSTNFTSAGLYEYIQQIFLLNQT